MAQFVVVPPERLPADVLSALLEEYASRDGTDYGDKETPLLQKVESLRRQLQNGDVQLLYDADSEEWDLLSRDEAAKFLDN